MSYPFKTMENTCILLQRCANWEVFVLHLGSLHFVVCTDVLWVQSGDTKLLLFAQVNVSLVYSPCVVFDGKLRWQVQKCRHKCRNNTGSVRKQRWQRLNRTHVSNTGPKTVTVGLRGPTGHGHPTASGKWWFWHGVKWKKTAFQSYNVSSWIKSFNYI